MTIAKRLFTRRRLRLVPLLAATSLAACTVGPDFERPAAPSETGYVSPSQTAFQTSGGPQAAIGAAQSLRWWEAFGSPELNALVDRAIENNNTIDAANATLERARARVAAVRGSGLPQVDANARVEHEKVNLAAFGFDSDTGNPEFDLYSVGGGVSYSLDLFGRHRRSVEQARAELESQRRQTEAAHLTIAGNVVNQVLQIASIRAKIAAANALLAEDQRNVELTQTRKRAGEGTLVEVLNAQSQYTNDRAEIPQYHQQLDAAEHMLAILVGEAPANFEAPALTLDELRLPSEIPVSLPSELVHKRPDILQSEADLHAATAAIGVATAQLYPDITLGATITQGAPDIGDTLGSAFRGFDIFAGLTAPIFHGGTLKAEQQAAVANAKATQAQYKQTVLEAFGQVADLLQAIKHDQQSIAEQQEAVDVAGQSLHLSRRSFQVGNSGVLEIVDAQRVYQRAISGMVDARARQYLDVARLYVATAGGWTGPATETQLSSAEGVTRATP